MKQYAIIVAGGSGSRMGYGMPKQFRSLCGRPLLWWSIKAFHEENSETEIIVVLPEGFTTLWKDFFSTLPDEDRIHHLITTGGHTRTESVKNGLQLAEDPDSLVAVHDGARPLVSIDVIRKGWEIAKETGVAIPVVAVTDSLRRIIVKNEKKSEKAESLAKDGSGSRTINSDKSLAVDRSEYVSVQTPQVFFTTLLKDAYESAEGENFTDDASVVEKFGKEVSLFEGSPDNIKVTNPKDMAIASAILGKDG